MDDAGQEKIDALAVEAIKALTVSQDVQALHLFLRDMVEEVFTPEPEPFIIRLERKSA
jgi:hypothetical protein